MDNINDFVKDFVTSWNGFLDDLVKTANLKLARKKTYRAYENILVPLFQDIVGNLKEDHTALYAAVHTELAENMASRAALSYLQREFTFFNRLVAELDEADEPKSEPVDKAIEAGETIKDSFEKLIEKLPERWKKILKVVNEILNLVKIAI